MGVFGNEQQLCPCYKKHQDFHKLIEFQDLVVYSHRTRTENVRQGEAVENAENSSRYVFILHNKKNVKITTSELISESGKKNISCPRCRKTFEHAQELMQNVKSVDGRTVMGICDHCRKNAQTSKNPFCACDEIVKKFISVEGKQKGDTDKHVKIWLSKMGHFEDSGKTLNKAKQTKTHAYSNLQVSQDLDSRTPRHEPKVEQMFYSDKHFQSDDTEMSETDLKEGSITQTVTFAKLIETVETSLDHTSHEGEKKKTIIPGHSIADSGITIVETHVGVKDLPRPSLKDRKQANIFQDDIPSMDAKEVLKRRHDLSLRHMMRYKKEADDPLSLTDKPDMYDIPKSAPWEQKIPNLENDVEPEMDIKIPTPTGTKHDLGPRVTPDPDYLSTRPVISSKTSQKDLQDQYFELGKVDKYHHDKIEIGFTGSGEKQKDINKRKQSYILGETLPLRSSVNKFGHKTTKLDQHVAKSKSGPTQTFGDVAGPQYSFYFPKEKKEEKKINLDVTSSQLIRDTHEKFRLQGEKDKKRKEEEHQRKLEQEQKKKLAREEKNLQADKKRRQDIENQKIAEQEKILTQEKDEINEGKKSKTEKDVSEVTKKEQKIKSALMKSKTEKPQQKTKDDLISKGKDKTRDTHDELSQKNKKPQKEKEEKENKERLKQEELQKDKENKERLKQEQLQKEKEKEEKKKEAQLKEKEKEEKKKEAQLKEKEKEEKKKEAQLKEKEKEEKKKEAQLKEIDATAKKEQSTKKKRDSSDEMKVPMPKMRSSIEKQGNGTIKKEEKVKESKRDTSKKEPPTAPTEPVDEYQKLQADRLKGKEEAAKNRKQREAEALAAKAREEAERKAKAVELKMKDIKILKKDDLETIRMVRIKQAAAMKPCDIEPELLEDHKCHHHRAIREFCPLCLNSELELEVLSLDNKVKRKKDKITDIIIGEEIFKYKPQPKKTKEKAGVPILFQKDFIIVADQQQEPMEVEKIIPKQKIPVEEESTKGILQYALSDRTFIEKGWTMLPTEKVMRKMNVYRMRPAHPEFDWFEHNKNKRLMTYDSGEKLAEFDDNGRGRLYYKTGRLALDYYDAKETNAQQRFVTYSSGEPDERGRTHPITILATFDYLGNGIVFDHAGKIRLKYNQTEGVVLDRGIGPVSHWKWHSLNDPPILQQVMIDTQMAQKDPEILKLGPPNEKTTRPDNEEMLAIEFDNFIKEKSKKLSQKFKPFQIKMKALKINEHFSLKVLDQATVYLIFRDGSTNVKLNIGMILDHQEIVDTDTAEVGDVANNMERFPARTDSLAGLQRSVAHAQRYERQHTERERRLRPPEPCGSADKLTAAASRPMRPPFRTIPPVGTSSSTSTGYCSRKPANNLYYNTRLL